MDATVTIEATSSDGHKSVDPLKRRKSRQQSRVTNGSALLPGVDGRSPWVRRCKDVIASHLSDLGGYDNTSAAERSIIRRAAVLTTELERLERDFALAGQASAEDLDTYARIAGNLRRMLESVGLKRRARNVGVFADGTSKTTEAEWSPLRARMREEMERATIDLEPAEPT